MFLGGEIIIETYYLIDYENVGADGLAGCDKLTRSDHIYIFFTKNAKRIDMSEIANHGEAELKMIEVPAGKQSTDIHIGSYLAYIAGKKESENKVKDCSVVIISKDNDYDNVIKFWKKETGIKASKALQIKVSAPRDTIVEQTTINKKCTLKDDGSIKTELNKEIMKAVRAAGFDAAIGNSVAKIATGFWGEERFMNNVHNKLRDNYPQYLVIYESIKPVLNKYSGVSSANSQPDKRSVNNQIQQLLSKAKLEGDVINYVASAVTKNVGAANEKQQIYRMIISKYGQKEGLNIYNHIKKHI